jgi:hypothetical protein
VTQFKIDYTFYFNIVFAAFTALMLYFNFRTKKMETDGVNDHDHGGGGISFKRVVVYLFVLILVIGALIYLL